MDNSKSEQFIEFCDYFYDKIVCILKQRYDQYGDVYDMLSEVEDSDNYMNSSIIVKANRALVAIRKFKDNSLEANEKNIDSFLDIVGYAFVWLWDIYNKEPDFIMKLEDKINEDNKLDDSCPYSEVCSEDSSGLDGHNNCFNE